MKARFIPLLFALAASGAVPVAAAVPGEPIQGNGLVHGGIYADPANPTVLGSIAAVTPVTFAGSFHALLEADPSHPDVTTPRLEEAWAARATPWVNLDPGNSSTATDLATLAAWEVLIRDWMTRVKAWTDSGSGRSLIIAPLQEMNGDWTSYGCYRDGSATLRTEKESYKQAFRRFVEIGRSVGLDETRVRWAFAPNGVSTFRCGPSADYYPGDGWVDIIGISSFNFGAALDRARGWQTPEQIMAPFDEIRSTITHNRPYVLAQVGTAGIGAGAGGDKEGWVRHLFEVAAADPNVVGLVYFNEDKSEAGQFRDWGCCPGPHEGWTGWQQGIGLPSTRYDWPLSNWFQPGPLPFNQTPPVALPDSAIVNPGGTVMIDVSANDHDPDELPTVGRVVGQGAHGTVSEGPGGTLRYRHNGDGSTGDVFTYAADDGNKLSPPAVVTITVAPTARTLGLVEPTTGKWHLRRPDGSGVVFYFGNPGDQAFLGDWDCDGIDTPGLFRRSDGFVYLRNSNTQGPADIRFFFGDPGDSAFAGDFNGDGCDTVSLYRPGDGRVFIANRLGANGGGLGAADRSFYFGDPGDVPFSGDFDGDGIDTVGLRRVSTGFVYLRNSNSQGIGDLSFFYGDPGDLVVAGSWIDGLPDTPAIFRPARSAFFLRYSSSAGPAEQVVAFGSGSWLPVAGETG